MRSPAVWKQDNTVREFVFNAGKSLTRLVDPDCGSPKCGCEYYDALFAPVVEHIPVTSIYSVSGRSGTRAQQPFVFRHQYPGGWHPLRIDVQSPGLPPCRQRPGGALTPESYAHRMRRSFEIARF